MRHITTPTSTPILERSTLNFKRDLNDFCPYNLPERIVPALEYPSIMKATKNQRLIAIV